MTAVAFSKPLSKHTPSNMDLAELDWLLSLTDAFKELDPDLKTLLRNCYKIPLSPTAVSSAGMWMPYGSYTSPPCCCK